MNIFGTSFWLDHVVFLGHVISSKGIEVDPRKDRGNIELGSTQKCYRSEEFPRNGWLLQTVLLRDFPR